MATEVIFIVFTVLMRFVLLAVLVFQGSEKI